MRKIKRDRQTERKRVSKIKRERQRKKQRVRKIMRDSRQRERQREGERTDNKNHGLCRDAQLVTQIYCAVRNKRDVFSIKKTGSFEIRTPATCIAAVDANHATSTFISKKLRVMKHCAWS